MFEIVTEFEEKIADFFGAPYAVATDCCTHAIELCLRLIKPNLISIPKHTYVSVPMTAIKVNQPYQWKNENWENFYYISDTIIDAAVHWQKNSYIKNTYMCVSFQKQKHLSLGRGGMILLDNKESKILLEKMAYDGRLRNTRWGEQNISTIGYHYYMTPETAAEGILKLPQAINDIPTKWNWERYPDISLMKVFQ